MPSCHVLILRSKKGFLQLLLLLRGGAMMMAEGYARASEKFGAAIVLDGPGIANAYADRYPVMLISGQISKYYEMMGALQDSTQSGLDLAAVLKPITHTSYHIRHVENLPRYFKATVKSMYGHHKGPSHFSVAKDVLLEEVNSTYRPIDPGIVGNRIFDLHAARSFSENVIKKIVVWPF